MNIVIVNAFGRSNRGDSVLLDECIAELKAAFPGGKISAAVFEGVDDARRVHPDIAWSERIGNSKGGGFGKIVTLWRLLMGWAACFAPALSRLLPRAQAATLDAMREADIVVSAPGGYIHDTNFAYYVALYHIWLGQILRKRSILAPQSIGPIERVLSRRLATYILGRSDIICSRESYTRAFLINDLGLAASIVRDTGDSAFWNFEVSDSAAAEFGEIDQVLAADATDIFGLTVVDWSFPKSSSPEADKEGYAQAIAEISDFMTRRHGTKTVIFNQVSEDLPMARRIAEKAGEKVYIDTQSREPWALRAMIKQSAVFLGTRFHSCIFSMMAGRPTTAIAYLPKTKFIMSDLELSHRVQNIESIDVSQLKAALERDFLNRASAVAEISSAVEAYRAKFKQFRDVLAGVAEEKKSELVSK